MKKSLTLALTSAAMLFSTFSHAAKTEKAILAGGCFWCMESDFEKLKGVKDVISGFTGGKNKKPTHKRYPQCP
ncbi:peptide-methionine (S)-S-oxide reductase, partial [Pseudoalteromonas agarivorans]|uniref:peptide-methionine (S)-S-oxide reductase n=1 Tax=Pseudoalteromonas agarivorans TaxID=176102 RepID=UPI0004CF33FF